MLKCVWVHGYKHGRGSFRKQGMGAALLRAAEQDARERGADCGGCADAQPCCWLKSTLNTA